MTEQTVFIHAPADLPTITTASFDWRNNKIKYATEDTLPGMTYFLGADGAAFDYTHNECWETIANFATDPECVSVIVISEHTVPSEADFKAYDTARHERDLYADCFGN